jgi:hypothetical protein
LGRRLISPHFFLIYSLTTGGMIPMAASTGWWVRDHECQWGQCATYTLPPSTSFTSPTMRRDPFLWGPVCLFHTTLQTFLFLCIFASCK